MPTKKSTKALYTYLHRYFKYYPFSGDFLVRIPRNGCGSKVGEPVVPKHITSRAHIKIAGHTYYLSHLIYILMTGKYAKYIIYTDKDPTNLRWNNIVACTHSDQLCRAKLRKDNKTGVKGIFYEKARRSYRASVTKDGKTYMKRFKRIGPAIQWLSVQRTLLHGEYATPANQSKPST